MAVGLVRRRRLDAVGILVLTGIAVGTVLGLVAWMTAYGRRARRRSEHLAAAPA